MNENSKLSSFWLRTWPRAFKKRFLVGKGANCFEEHPPYLFCNFLDRFAFKLSKGFDFLHKIAGKSNGPLHAFLTFRGIHPQIMVFSGFLDTLKIMKTLFALVARA